MKFIHLLKLIVCAAPFFCYQNCQAEENKQTVVESASLHTQQLFNTLQNNTSSLKKQVTTYYNQLVQSISQYQSRVEILPQATEFYFDDNSNLYDYLAIPVATLPTSGMKFELFGQLYDPNYYQLCHLKSDDPLYGYQPQGDLDWTSSKLAVGLGSSYSLSAKTKLRAIYTSGTIPGLGDSKLALSMQFHF